ncbi:hypothetical protein ACFY9Q_02435 [Streptomyces sp. NPDC012389]|uniref:hypothetical protein n=1 Tax=Streptomyces sp. NPDC012389 TaxID=3364830 RepID=UPI0036EB436C
MALTAAELVFRPPAAWWPTVWMALWVLTGVLLVAGALLRAAQKPRLRHIDRPDCCDGPGGSDDCDDPPGDHAEGYGRAA